MSIEKIREEFEDFILSRNAEERGFWEDRGGLLGVIDGKYFVSWVQNDWELWQASRESLVIELPFLFPFYRQGVVEVIEASGLKVKA